jgi:CRP-like cAMP-binding protein
MADKEALKKIEVFKGLSEDMLETLAALTKSREYEEGEVVFREGDSADGFFMLKRGKILLEQRISDTATVSLGAVKPGYSFGWSAILDGGTFTLDTICSEDSEVLYIERKEIIGIMEENAEMAKILNQNLIRIIKNRLDHRTIQLLRVIKNHPDMNALFQE